MMLQIPENQDILNLKVGDRAPSCFGRDGIVTEIYAMKNDINGRPFVCYYEQGHNGLKCSMSMKAGELIRTVRASELFTSAELDQIEQIHNKA